MNQLEGLKDNNAKQRSVPNSSGISHPSVSPAAIAASHTVVQAKLEMTEPGDQYEREADSMADIVMSRSVPTGPSKPVTPGSSPRTVSKLPSSHSSVTVSPSLESAIDSSRGGGHSMPSFLRSKMEPEFNADFSSVRFHTDSKAAEMSSSINAKAFTSGRDVYFAAGQYNPHSQSGQHLIAHELTHVVQAGPTICREVDSSNVGEDFDYYEGQAGSALPVSCGDFDSQSKDNLDYFIKSFKSNVSKFDTFLKGGFKNSDIPDIRPLLNDGTNCLSYLSCENNGKRITITNAEVRNYLMKEITTYEANLFRAWMIYCNKGKNALNLSSEPRNGDVYRFDGGIIFDALSLRNLDMNDEFRIKHTYTLHLISSVNYGFKWLSQSLCRYRLSYSNNMGLSWSFEASQFAEHISLGIGISLGSEEGADDDQCNAVVTTDTWYSPKDFSDATLNTQISGPGYSFEKDSGSAISGMTFWMKGKPNLTFDASGFCNKKEGTSFNYNLSAGEISALSALYDYSPITHSQKELGNDIVIKDYRETKPYYTHCEVYFDTGSYQITDFQSLTFLAEKIYKAYSMGINLKSIDIHITGYSSPMWKNGRNTEDRMKKNQELSQKRANAVQRELQMMLLGIDRISYYCYAPTDTTTVYNESVIGKGAEAAYEETKDENNNDQEFRRVDVFVNFVLTGPDKH